MDQAQIVKQLLEYRDLLLGFIIALTRDHLVAEEIFQETSVAILEEAQKGTSVANFPAWAREIARRRVAGYYRRTSRQQGIEQLSSSLSEVIDQAFAENEQSQDGQQRMKYLLECLERMAGRSRDVIVRFYKQNQSLKAIAEALNWQPDSVKVALSRARKSLNDCIQVKLAQEKHGS